MPISVIEEKLKTLPEEYIDMVSDYIDSLKSHISEKESKSGKGMAAKYANPDLIQKEKEALAEGLLERYGKSMSFRR